MTIVKSLLDNILNKNAEGTAADFIAIMNEKVSSALDTKRVEIAQSMFQKEETESLDEANYKHATIEKPGHPLHGKTGRIFYKHDDGRINVQLANPHKRWDVTNLTLKPGEFKLKEETELQLEDLSVDLDEAEYAHTEFTGKIGKNWKTKGEIPTGTRSVKGHYGGGFVTDEDGNEISKPTPAVKKGRGRPKKNAGETGEKFNTDAIAALMKSKMGALPKGKSRKITGE
jgi:hypothetical protein